MQFILCKVVFVQFTSSPLSLVQKISPLLNPKLCFVVEGSRKVVHFWCSFGSLPYCRFSQIASLAFFALLPLAIACQILRTFEKFPVSLSAKSARFSANRGASRIPTRWACASQPGLPPLRAQFRFGIATDWSSSCFSV